DFQPGRRGRVGIVRRDANQSSLDRILPHVIAMAQVIVSVVNAMVVETLPPDQEPVPQFFLGPERETAFDVLQSLLEGNIGCWGQDKVKMIRHDDELMELETRLLAIFLHDVDQQTGHIVSMEDWVAVVGHRCDEERTNFLWSKAHRSPGLKPRYFKGT